jgi:hypothetical protein
MNVPYTIQELDALLKACVSFTDDHQEPYFMTGNIAGRGGVSPDIDSVRRMMDWVAEMDKGLLEYSGLGKDNVPYFRLGRDARRAIGNGGFKGYLRNRTRGERLERARLWAPICISVLALVVSILAWQTPKGSSGRIDDLGTQLNALRSDQEESRSILATMRADLDTISSRLPTTTPTGR